MQGFMVCKECDTAVSWELLLTNPELAKKAHDDMHTKVLTTQVQFPYKLKYENKPNA